MTDLTPRQRAAVDQASAHLRDLQADLETHIALIRALAQVLTERYPLRGRS